MAHMQHDTPIIICFFPFSIFFLSKITSKIHYNIKSVKADLLQKMCFKTPKIDYLDLKVCTYLHEAQYSGFTRDSLDPVTVITTGEPQIFLLAPGCSPFWVFSAMPSNLTSFVTHISAVYGYDGGLWHKRVRKILSGGRRQK